MKKYFNFVLMLCLMLVLLTGCKQDNKVPIREPIIPYPMPVATIIPTPDIEPESPVNETIIVPTPTIEPTPTPYENITMGFVGDMYLDDLLYNHYQENNHVNGFLANGLDEYFKNVDIMVANHEYVATDLPDSARDTRQLFNFKSPTDREYLWNEMGVDVVSLANNHAMDYGRDSLVDCLNILDELGIKHCGAGLDLNDAKKPVIIEQNGKKIGIIAASRFIVDGDWYATEEHMGVLTTYESTPYFNIVKEEITRMKEEEKCDFVVIYVHFGVEKSNQFNSTQEFVAHGYVDAGADLVIGSHAHVLQGIEIYNGVPIYYNLGNFLFGRYKSDTMFVEISINEDNTCNTKIIPCVAQNFVATLSENEEKERILQYVESISKNVTIDKDGNVYEK